MTYEFRIVPAQYDVDKREVQLLVGDDDRGFSEHSFCCASEIDEFIAQLQAMSNMIFRKLADSAKQKQIPQQKTMSEKMKDYNNYLNQLPDIPPEVPGFW